MSTSAEQKSVEEQSPEQKAAENFASWRDHLKKSEIAKKIQNCTDEAERDNFNKENQQRAIKFTICRLFLEPNAGDNWRLENFISHLKKKNEFYEIRELEGIKLMGMRDIDVPATVIDKKEAYEALDILRNVKGYLNPIYLCEGIFLSFWPEGYEPPKKGTLKKLGDKLRGKK